MASPTYRVPMRRRREGKTDYRRRKSLLRSGKPRAVVRRSLKYVTVQFVANGPGGDRVLAASSSRELPTLGWKAGCSSTTASYLAGYLAGKRAVKKGISSAVLDIGLQTPTKGGVVFAALRGLLDAGIEMPHDPEVLPSDERLASATKAGTSAIEETRSRIEEVL
ncbi:MAG: 50S ribosomal protein L18 [Candidatus Thermoplasmatota archaeon]